LGAQKGGGQKITTLFYLEKGGFGAPWGNSPLKTTGGKNPPGKFPKGGGGFLGGGFKRGKNRVGEYLVGGGGGIRSLGAL